MALDGWAATVRMPAAKNVQMAKMIGRNFIGIEISNSTWFDERELAMFKLHSRFSALRTAFTDASSMFVSTPAPQRDWPSAVLIWM